MIFQKFQKNFFVTWFLSFCHLLNTFCSGALLLIVFWSYLTCELKKIYLFKKKYPRDPSLSLKISVWRLNDFLSPIYGVLFYTKMCTLKTKIDIINIFILVLPLRWKWLIEPLKGKKKFFSWLSVYWFQRNTCCKTMKHHIFLDLLVRQ